MANLSTCACDCLRGEDTWKYAPSTLDGRILEGVANTWSSDEHERPCRTDCTQYRSGPRCALTNALCDAGNYGPGDNDDGFTFVALVGISPNCYATGGHRKRCARANGGTLKDWL